ncbi:unnamed protein product [Auanema sp. JU1783]|nr:unnamed protein product [Auanema sp. JU1783]
MEPVKASSNTKGRTQLVKVEKKPIGFSIKRRAPEDWSPVKRPKKRAPRPVELEEDNEKLTPILKQAGEEGKASPTKAVSFSPKKSIRIIPSHKSPARVNPPRSPLKKLLTNNHDSPFRSLFDTPEKDTESPLSTLVLRKASFETPPKSPSRSLKSPRKPIQREICIKNVEQLLMPTPEKKPKEELEAFPAAQVVVNEDGTETKIRKVYEGIRKKKDENFVKINMRKKSFVRGKVTAEQKRKMARKMKWKKRFAK